MKNVDININGNDVKVNNGISINQILSNKFLKMEKFDCSITVNRKKINHQEYNYNLKNGDSIIIKINGKNSGNLGIFKKSIDKNLRLIKKIKSFFDILSIRIFLYTFITPYYISKTSNLKFYTPNKVVLSRAKDLLSSEPDTIAWINSFDKGSVLLDIGANIGSYSIYSGLLGHRVVAVEPLWSNFSVLCDNVIKNDITSKVIPLNIALSNRVKIENLSVSNSKAGSSHNSIDDTVFQSIMTNSESNLSVMGSTIDVLWQEFDLPIPNHIKIDVDGIEEKVIYGGKSLFNNKLVRSILVEVSVLENSQCNNVISFLGEIGFELESVMGFKMSTIDFSKLNSMRGSGGTVNLIFCKT